MGNAGEKKPDKGYVFGRLWGYLAQSKGLLLLGVLLSITGNLLALTGPILSGWALDCMVGGTGAVNFPLVFRYAGWMAVCYLSSAVLTYLLSRVMIRLSQNVVHALRRDLFGRFMDLPMRRFDAAAVGDLVSCITYDVDTVGDSLSTDLVQAATSVVTVAGSLAMMLYLSPPLSAVFLITIPISIGFARYRTKKVRPMFARRSAAMGTLNGYAEELVSSLKTIKAYHREGAFTSRFDAKNRAAEETHYAADYLGSMMGPSMGFINNMTLTLLSILGAMLYLWQLLSLGTLSSFVLYSRKFSGPINEMANIASELQSAAAASERIFKLIDEPPEQDDPSGAGMPERVEGNVAFEKVRFGYRRDREILHGIDLEARQGQFVAIVGPTGAGKTTIINLLMRFYDPDSGVVRLDGCDLRRMTRGSLRGACSMVLQDAWLFSGTVLENIAYGRPEATREEVIAAAKAAYIHEFICHLPQGYDTVLTEGGLNLSKGQKQLFTIARALLLDAKVLILDEATSNVDTATERQIQTAMKRLMQGRTCIVIAHRLSTVQNADTIVVIENGRVAEQGRHQELLEKKGAYARMYQAQFR